MNVLNGQSEALNRRAENTMTKWQKVKDNELQKHYTER